MIEIIINIIEAIKETAELALCFLTSEIWELFEGVDFRVIRDFIELYYDLKSRAKKINKKKK
ncbi:hypothetical protein [Pseudoalteromonas sp.]|uniref:hypothetical protein n=1 Tax=Pseudoalteromonas sp. TaxID=53249 RepID=UPI00300372A6